MPPHKVFHQLKGFIKDRKKNHKKWETIIFSLNFIFKQIKIVANGFWCYISLIDVILETIALTLILEIAKRHIKRKDVRKYFRRTEIIWNKKIITNDNFFKTQGNGIQSDTLHKPSTKKQFSSDAFPTASTPQPIIPTTRFNHDSSNNYHNWTATVHENAPTYPTKDSINYFTFMN